MRDCKHSVTDLSPKDVSQILSKNYRTILRWTKDGKVFKHSYKCECCGAYLIPSSDVDAYIESIKHQTLGGK